MNTNTNSNFSGKMELESSTNSLEYSQDSDDHSNKNMIVNKNSDDEMDDLVELMNKVHIGTNILTTRENITNFMKLCKVGNLTEVKEMYLKDIVNELDSYGENSIFYAFHGHNIEVMEFLIESKDIDLTIKNKLNLTIVDLIINSNFDNKYELLHKIKNQGLKPGCLLVDVVIDNFKTSILKYDNIIEFKKQIYLFSFDVITIASSLKANKIVEYCIENEFGLKHINNDLLCITHFFSLCHFSNDKLINLYIDKLINNKAFLIMKNNNGQTALEYLPGKYHNINVRVLNMEHDSSNKLTDFKIYEQKDFEFVKYNIKNKSGSYGEAVHVRETGTNKDMIIKKFTSDAFIVSETSVSEIMILKYINEHNTHIVPHIYGIHFHDDNVYLVQEYLVYTFKDIVSLYNNIEIKAKYEEYKNIFRNLIEDVTIINYLGISHNDLKDENMMMDKNGRMKIIDFGLSEYYGLAPNSYKTDKSMMTNYIKPPEKDENTIMYESEYKKTLNADIYSLGVIFMNVYMDTKYYKYGYDSDKNKFYQIIIHNSHEIVNGKKVIQIINGEEVPKIVEREEFILDQNGVISTTLNKIDPYLTNLMKKMININPSERWFGKDCLKHVYFTNNDHKPKKYSDTFSLFNIPNIRSYDKMENELIYFNEIVSSTHKLKFLNVDNTIKSDNITKENADTLLDWLKDYNTNIDILINTIFKVRLCLNKNDSLKLQKIQLMSTIIYVLYSFVLDGSFSFSYIIKILGDSIKIEDVNTQLKELFQSLDMFDFIPIRTNISYVTTTLQKENIFSSYIIACNNFIEKSLIKWAVGSTGKQIEIQKLIIIIYKIFDRNDMYKFDYEEYEITDEEYKNVNDIIM